jgi:hypothetical protein
MSLNPVDSIVRRKCLRTECAGADGDSAGSLPDVSAGGWLMKAMVRRNGHGGRRPAETDPGRIDGVAGR